MTEATIEATPAQWKPKPWLAALFGFFLPPLGLLYVAATRQAGIFLIMSLALALVAMFMSGTPILMMAMALLYQAGCAVYCFRFALNTQAPAVRPWYSRIRYLVLIFLSIHAFIISYRSFLIEPFRVPSGAMLPSIKIGQHVIVKKWGYGHYTTLEVSLFRRPISAELKRGDVVVFDYPFDSAQTYIKRLIGLPGDTVSYRNKQLTINGTAIEQSAAGESLVGFEVFKLFNENQDGLHYQVAINPDAPADAATKMAMNFPNAEACQYDSSGVICKVPAGNYFVMGDNRDQSADSRVWGFVPATNIVGKVIYTF